MAATKPRFIFVLTLLGFVDTPAACATDATQFREVV